MSSRSLTVCHYVKTKGVSVKDFLWHLWWKRETLKLDVGGSLLGKCFEIPHSPMQLMPVLNYSNSPAFHRPVVNTVLINDMNGLGVISAQLDSTHITQPVKQIHYHGSVQYTYIFVCCVMISFIIQCYHIVDCNWDLN